MLRSFFQRNVRTATRATLRINFLYVFITFIHIYKSCIELFRGEKNVHATIPKGNMGYDQYTVPNDCSCRTYFCCFPLAIANITSQTSRAILSNFFEEQCTQNHPQHLSGLSRALFPTTFREIAVNIVVTQYGAGSG